MDVCKIESYYPVRRVMIGGQNYYSSADFVKLFDAWIEASYFKDMKRVRVPCKYNSENERTLIVMNEQEARVFVEERLREKGLLVGDDIKWQLDLFMKSVNSNKKPHILEPHTEPERHVLQPLPAGYCKSKADREPVEIDTNMTLSLIKMYKSFVDDVRTFISA